MLDYKIVQQVSRKPKPMTGFLRKVMVGSAVFFILLGITIHQSFMLAGCLLLLLYFAYDILSQRDYEYTLDDNLLSIDVILGKRYRRPAHVLDLNDLQVAAPSAHPAVDRYRKGGEEKIRKFDYTSYDDDVPYYTMIILENGKKIKLLLDLNDQMLQAMKQKYPEKIILSL